jgi:hypothetical protein
LVTARSLSSSSKTLQTVVLPSFVKDLHEAILDGLADQWDWTDQQMSAVFNLRPEDTLYFPQLKNAVSITLVYQRGISS